MLTAGLSKYLLDEFQNLLELSGYATLLDKSKPSPTDYVDQGDDSSLTFLIDLFQRGLSQPVNKARLIFSNGLLDMLEDLGILQSDHDGIRSLYQFQTYHGLLLFSDYHKLPLPRDFILPVGPSGRYLADMTIRRRGGSVLDLGCGCGIQSLLASSHSDRVTATDINTRALDITALNAALNGFSNVNTLHGSYFRPVEDQSFDTICMNLPYVISPENRFTYRDSGEKGDISLWRIIREIPDHLNEGGFAHIMINWIHARSESWWLSFQDHLSLSGVDAWLIYYRSYEPEEYAGLWTDSITERDDWTRWYQLNEMEQFGMGFLILRKRSGLKNWFCSAQVDRLISAPAGDHLLSLFQAQDYLENNTMNGEIARNQVVPINLEVTANPGMTSFNAHTVRGLNLHTSILPVTADFLSRRIGATSISEYLTSEHPDGHEQKKLLPGMVEDLTKLTTFGMVKLAL
jgi:methylase of polypeptide subunit release factors